MNTKATVFAASALVLLASLTGCASGDAKAAEEASKGKPEVHARIKAETNCDKLQKDFDLAVKNNRLPMTTVNLN